MTKERFLKHKWFLKWGVLIWPTSLKRR